jgi:hypothetical protein
MTGRVAGLLGILLAAGAGSGAWAERQGEAASAPTNEWSQRLLNEHNRERDRTGVPRLVWNNRLAGEAQAWADELSRDGWLQHAPDDSTRGAGENLWMGSAGYFAPETIIDSFNEERSYYRPGTFPDVSRTGNWEDVGHYTQIVWRDTRQVGCAMARGARFDFLVCRYWPAGNWVGERPF